MRKEACKSHWNRSDAADGGGGSLRSKGRPRRGSGRGAGSHRRKLPRSSVVAGGGGGGGEGRG
ncbi:hypothetical protein IEQ34_002478 [Dendrobium chrysotoxum]|uniref:Uncharacterized protein n=1 Tax=Dendrobium chrysotoxum TaxID=161865 RepID=A0AAV7HJM4_DENCH|nr:hypothetical protein IEQ34_002478 [Dendrobium chrysotoxum]